MTETSWADLFALVMIVSRKRSYEIKVFKIEMEIPIILSHFQTQEMQLAWSNGEKQVLSSLDLGLTVVEASLGSTGVAFPKGDVLGWGEIEKISASENNCFCLRGGELLKIEVFSEFANRHYSLMPTHKAPTMLISGIPMHRIKDSNPYDDTLEKIKALRPIIGHVLDTATGLGYTAIQAAKTADRVVTIELDPAVLQVTLLNPWSSQLFDHPKIEQFIGDSFEVIKGLEDHSFDRILHDPPAFSLAGHLYGGDFYTQLYRVLKRRGRLYHYIGNPESKSGKSITRGVIQRLKAAGFSRIDRKARAFGVVAYK